MIVVAVVLLAAGAAALGCGIVARGRSRDRSLAAILDLPFGERDVAVESVTERSGIKTVLAAADRIVERADRRGRFAAAVEAADMPLRPGEFLAAATLAALVVAAVVAMITGQLVLGGVAALGTVYAAASAPRVLAARRRRKIEEQLPDALSAIAASLESGHTFLRSIQTLAEEIEGPLAAELGTVLNEATLGSPTIDALERMAARVDVEDLTWVVHAIRVQSGTGGKLAELLHTLSSFMRDREDVRREVKVLTAEGQMSAIVLGALPVVLVIALQAVDPGYLAPMLKGWGLVVLAGAAASTVFGMVMIRRMARIEV
jgi:tight adherence protein B